MSRITPKHAAPSRALSQVAPRALDVPEPAPAPSGFLSFRYSYTEVTAQGDRTQVKGRRVRLDNGRLNSESFEGELGADAFATAARRVQEQVLAQSGGLLNPFAWLLPVRRRRSDDGD
jgi:hypothetical protein